MSRFTLPYAPAGEGQTIVHKDVRVSVLSDEIIRVERDLISLFEDEPSQFALCRNFANPQFKWQICGNKLAVTTKSRVFHIDLKTLRVCVEINGKTVCATNRKNLGGTARTLDGTFGLLGGWKGIYEGNDHFFISHIRKGIFASDGVSEIDDGKSLLLTRDGGVQTRREGTSDKYVLAFGNDYLNGLKQFYALTGYTPLLPKYALGNWWSRYHEYTDKEYLALMDEFEKRDIPFSVATIDMDWHIVKNVPKDAEYKSFQGAGWTGYTFEKSLFPDYRAFLKNLKDRGLAVTMNLHPRDGVRYFETQYADMARACGVDPATKQTVKFNLTDKRFLNAYFDILHHPYEQDGVDFWWIDWQQGTKDEYGVDPLWLLNHYHYLDNSRDGRQGLILSRYAGLGSHRYPLGFSGDTFVCWHSLRIQPYFTSLASNAGYSWWSHDIGGHMCNRGNEELYLRWLQYGVFSPINRLHSNNKCYSKEPWLYPSVEKTAVEYLRLRHRLLPYLYTANVRTSKDGIPLIAPMYYYTDAPQARQKQYRNQYYFGEQLFVAPIVSRSKKGVSTQKIWLPDGEWTDFFTGETLKGGEHVISRTLEQYPVFAKQGAIIPMLLERSGNSQSFDSLEIRIYPGENTYTMYDEQGKIDFSLRRDGDAFVLDIIPDNDIKTEHLKVVFCSSDAYVASDGEREGTQSNVFETECKRTAIAFKKA